MWSFGSNISSKTEDAGFHKTEMWNDSFILSIALSCSEENLRKTSAGYFLLYLELEKLS